MRKISPIAYVPGPGSLQSASALPAMVYLGSFVVVAFIYSDPLVLTAACVGATLAGLGCGARQAIRFSLRLGLTLAIMITVVNCLVTDRGATVLARLGEWPILGNVDVTLEAMAAGAVIGLRATATMVAMGVYSACVDPDRVLQALHGVARRSALTASLISRLVPLAAGDQARLREAARLRGPGAAAVGRAAMAHRLLAGSLDRSVDLAATLELRGYSRPNRPGAPSRRASRFDLRFWAAGIVLLAVAITARAAGFAAFTTYPEIGWSPGPVTFALTAMVALAGLASWRVPSGPGSWLPPRWRHG